MGENLKAIFNKLGMILAFLTVVLYAFLILNGAFSWVAADNTVVRVLNIIRNFAALAVVGVVCLELIADKGLIPFIIVAALFAIIIISMFFPQVQDQLVGLVKK